MKSELKYSVMASPLPDGWEKRESSSKPGKYFYFNPKTKESLWEKPSGAKKHSSDSSADHSKKAKIVC